MVKSISSPHNIKASSYEINSIASSNLTCDGLRSFDYDESNHLSKVKITRNIAPEAASINCLHNGLGQPTWFSTSRCWSWRAQSAATVGS